MRTRARFRLAVLGAALALGLAACGDDDAPTAVSDDAAQSAGPSVAPRVVSGFTGTHGYVVPDGAETLGEGADGEGGVAIGARQRVRNARVTVFDAQGDALGSALTDASGLVTFRPPQGALSAIAVELRGTASAELYDVVLDRWVPFPDTISWRALLPRLGANIGLGPLSEAWVARYEEAGRSVVGKSASGGAPPPADRRPADVGTLVRARGIDPSDLASAERGLARAVGRLGVALEALGLALDRRIEVPAALHTGLWGAPLGDRAELAAALRPLTFAGGRRGYVAGGGLLDSGGVDVALLYEVLAAFDHRTPAAGVPSDRLPEPPGSPVLALSAALSLDHAPDGELDCASGERTLPAAGEVTIACFGDASASRLATMLQAVGLPATAPESGFTLSAATVMRDGRRFLIESDLGGVVLATDLETGGGPFERRVVSTSAEMHGLGPEAVLVSEFDPAKSLPSRHRLLFVGPDDDVGASAGPSVALGAGFSGRDLGPLLAPGSRGRPIVEASAWRGQFAILLGDGSLYLGGVVDGLRRSLGAVPGEWVRINGRPLSAATATQALAPEVVRSFAWKNANALYLLDGERNCVLDTETAVCTAPPVAGRAWRMAVDLEGGLWMFAGESLYVLGPSPIGDAAAGGGRDPQVWTRVELPAGGRPDGVALERLLFAELSGFAVASVPPGPERAVGETALLMLGGPPGDSSGIELLTISPTFTRVAGLPFDPNVVVVTELIHAPDLTDDTRSPFAIGATFIDDLGDLDFGLTLGQFVF